MQNNSSKENWTRGLRNRVPMLKSVIYQLYHQCLYTKVNYPTIKKSWVSHTLFWTSVPIFEAGPCWDLALALSLFLCQFYGHPHLHLFSSMGGRDATMVSFFLCLAAGSQLTQTQTWWPQMMCGLCIPFHYCHVFCLTNKQPSPVYTYCAISINLATPVTRYTLAEILVSALCPGHCYISQKIWQVTTRGPKNQGIWGGPAKVFGTLPKWLLPLLHLSALRGPVTCYCRIDRNGTVFLSAMYHMEITRNSLSCIAFFGGGFIVITRLTLLFLTNRVSPHHLEKMQDIMHLKP